ncbi:MAG: hydrolase [Patescibacteria group bacterium]
MEEKVCCPKFNPIPWEDKEVVFENRMFIKDTMTQIMHMPLPGSFAKTIGRMWEKIENADAKPAEKDLLMLCYDPSPWKSEMYVSVTREVPDAENVTISGTFMTKVFDGPYNHVPKWIKIMDDYVADKGKKVQKYYFYYTTCPKCAKKYGHNYVVVFAQV